MSLMPQLAECTIPVQWLGLFLPVHDWDAKLSTIPNSMLPRISPSSANQMLPFRKRPGWVARRNSPMVPSIPPMRINRAPTPAASLKRISTPTAVTAALATENPSGFLASPSSLPAFRAFFFNLHRASLSGQPAFSGFASGVVPVRAGCKVEQFAFTYADVSAGISNTNTRIELRVSILAITISLSSPEMICLCRGRLFPRSRPKVSHYGHLGSGISFDTLGAAL